MAAIDLSDASVFPLVKLGVTGADVSLGRRVLLPTGPLAIRVQVFTFDGVDLQVSFEDHPDETNIDEWEWFPVSDPFPGTFEVRGRGNRVATLLIAAQSAAAGFALVIERLHQ